MKKNLMMIAGLIALAALFAGCVTPEPSAGSLPKKWWTLDRGEIQNHYRGSADGAEKSVVIFVGFSDSKLNTDKSTALENARMDASMQLSRYLSQKVTGIQQISQHIEILDAKVADGSIDQESADILVEKISEKLSSFRASVTTTQFSSFKQEGSHTQEKDGKIEAWVCYSMSDQILEETRQLQTAAFQTLMEETEEYKEIMKRINEEIARALEENIMSEATF